MLQLLNTKIKEFVLLLLGETPLYEAGINGHVEVVEILITYGANVSLLYSDGKILQCTAIHQGVVKS